MLGINVPEEYVGMELDKITAALVAELEATGVRLADTRKTTPGLRLLEKYAFQCEWSK